MPHDIEWHGDVDLDAAITEDQAHTVAEVLGDAFAGVTIHADPASPRTTLGVRVTAGTLRQAAAEAERLVRHAAGTAGIKATPLRLEVLTYDELDQRLRQPTVPDLVGLSEIAGKLDVSRQRAGQLADRPDFPRPVARLASGPVFAAAAVDAFAQTWARRTGRPPARAE